MKAFLALWVAFWIFVGVCWIGNVVRLTQCDWSSQGSWKGEVVHTIGVFTPVFLVSVWLDDK